MYLEHKIEDCRFDFVKGSGAALGGAMREQGGTARDHEGASGRRKGARVQSDNLASPEDLLADIQSLDERHQDNSILRRFLGKIEPLVHGIERYAQVMDVYKNAKPEFLSILWGSVHIILKVSNPRVPI